ncbi:hypothetical protein ACJX0J_017494 [Zea mays]
MWKGVFFFFAKTASKGFLRDYLYLFEINIIIIERLREKEIFGKNTRMNFYLWIYTSEQSMLDESSVSLIMQSTVLSLHQAHVIIKDNINYYLNEFMFTNKYARIMSFYLMPKIATTTLKLKRMQRKNINTIANKMSISPLICAKPSEY